MWEACLKGRSLLLSAHCIGHLHGGIPLYSLVPQIFLRTVGAIKSITKLLTHSLTHFVFTCCIIPPKSQAMTVIPRTQHTVEYKD